MEAKNNFTDTNNNKVENFYTDLTHLAENHLLLPFYGRDKIINEVIDVLNRKIKSNVILLGEPGVGKTAIVEGLAVKIVNGKVPISLIGKKIFSLNIVELLSGSRYRGDFEERLNNVLKKIISTGSGILFIDEIHTIVNTGGNYNLDISNILKPILSRSNFKCIGATTNSEYYRTFINSDDALARRFKNINVPEMTPEETYALLKTVKYSFEKTHKVHFSDKILKCCIDISNKFIINKKFPDKAIDIIDNAGALVAKKNIPKPINKIFNRINDLRTKKLECIQNYDYSRAIKIRDEIKSLTNDVKNNINTTSEYTYKIVKYDALISTISRMSEYKENVIQRFVSQINTFNGNQTPIKISHENYLVSENIEKCIDSIMKNFYFYSINNSPIGRFIYYKSEYNDPKKLGEIIISTLYKSTENYLFIDVMNFVGNENNNYIDTLSDFIDIISEKIKKHYNSLILIDNFEKMTYPMIKFIYKIFSTGIFQDNSHKTINCKNAIFILSLKSKEETTDKIGFYKGNTNKNNYSSVFSDNKCNDIFLKIAKTCEYICPNNNISSLIKTEIINEIDKLTTISNNYGLNLLIPNNFIETFSQHFNKELSSNDQVKEILSKKIMDKLFVLLKKNKRLQIEKRSYLLKVENKDICIVETEK